MSQIAGVGAGSLQQLAVVVQQPVDVFHQRLDLQRIAQSEPLLMALVDPAQLAAQQMKRTQAVDYLEHEAQHQAGGGEAETEEEADPGLLQGLGQGAAVLGHHQGKHLVRSRQQHSAGHDQQGLLVGPLADEEIRIPEGRLQAVGAQVHIPQGAGTADHGIPQLKLPVITGIGLAETGVRHGLGDHGQTVGLDLQAGEQIVELQPQAVGFRLLPVVAHHGLQAEAGGEQEEPAPDQSDGHQPSPQGTHQPHSSTPCRAGISVRLTR